MTEDPLTPFLDGRRQPKPCIVARQRQTLAQRDKAAADLLDQALAHPDTIDSRISAWMREQEVPAGTSSVTAHRSGSCCCG